MATSEHVRTVGTHLKKYLLLKSSEGTVWNFIKRPHINPRTHFYCLSLFSIMVRGSHLLQEINSVWRESLFICIKPTPLKRECKLCVYATFLFDERSYLSRQVVRFTSSCRFSIYLFTS